MMSYSELNIYFILPENSSKVEAQVSTPTPAIIPPPPDIQPVIDKLAEYVARNGLKFEASVRAKNDPRYVFLPEVFLQLISSFKPLHHL